MRKSPVIFMLAAVLLFTFTSCVNTAGGAYSLAAAASQKMSNLNAFTCESEGTGQNGAPEKSELKYKI